MIKVTPSRSAWPDRIKDTEYLVSVQRSSPERDPIHAVAEFAEAITAGELPQVQVVRFGDGFRWTYDVAVTPPWPDALYDKLLKQGLGQELLDHLFAPPDHERARTLHTKLRETLLLAAGAPTW